MTALLILAIVCAVLLAPSLLILAARLLSESPKGVIDEVMALADVSLPDRLAAVTCLHEARRVERRTWLYGTPTKLLEVLNALMLLTWAGTPGVRDVIAKMTRGPE